MKKTQWLITGVLTSLVAGTISGCSQDLPPKPDDKRCADWEWDDDQGVWQCDDTHSGYYHHYYHGGSFFKSKSALHKSSAYKSYKSSSSFKGGFGSGSRGGFGG
ncbi:hypothetical protein IEC97_15950 [Neobacillus cucumis]|uniref:hypothetical protein n=1 Tax=Neobacillus cucumis TaxID=1740721 RepID=UPI0018E051A7|nr:hypothetical protein [Neobacillus cucumis]MBI0578859.1 hypothetical protein [Neobacillus cucumis]